MAENLFAMLQKAQETASTADSKMFGVEVGIVTNVKDPDKLGRVKVCFPRLPGKPESDWVRVAQPAAGAGRGFYWLPHVNDEVLVAFERGEAHRPYVIGSLWNGKDKPIKGAYEDENTTIFIQTKSGHQIILDDKSGQEKIVIADKSGNRTLTFDVKNKKFLVEAKEGDVEIHAEKKIILECEDLEIKTKKTGKIDIGSTFDLNVKDKANFKAGPQLNIKASRVNIN
ncbi:MAG: phage baseplate assembly protein V [Myxococcales bacterium]|nr:phage baseplate assembly protein V [Myxococcales bacterium]